MTFIDITKALGTKSKFVAFFALSGVILTVAGICLEGVLLNIGAGLMSFGIQLAIDTSNRLLLLVAPVGFFLAAFTLLFFAGRKYISFFSKFAGARKREAANILAAVGCLGWSLLLLSQLPLLRSGLETIVIPISSLFFIIGVMSSALAGSKTVCSPDVASA